MKKNNLKVLFVLLLSLAGSQVYGLGGPRRKPVVPDFCMPDVNVEDAHLSAQLVFGVSCLYSAVSSDVDSRTFKSRVSESDDYARLSDIGEIFAEDGKFFDSFTNAAYRIVNALQRGSSLSQRAGTAAVLGGSAAILQRKMLDQDGGRMASLFVNSREVHNTMQGLNDSWEGMQNGVSSSPSVLFPFVCLMSLTSKHGLVKPNSPAEIKYLRGHIDYMEIGEFVSRLQDHFGRQLLPAVVKSVVSIMSKFGQNDRFGDVGSGVIAGAIGAFNAVAPEIVSKGLDGVDELTEFVKDLELEGHFVDMRAYDELFLSSLDICRDLLDEVPAMEIVNVDDMNWKQRAKHVKRARRAYPGMSSDRALRSMFADDGVMITSGSGHSGLGEPSVREVRQLVKQALSESKDPVEVVRKATGWDCRRHPATKSGNKNALRSHLRTSKHLDASLLKAKKRRAKVKNTTVEKLLEREGWTIDDNLSTLRVTRWAENNKIDWKHAYYSNYGGGSNTRDLNDRQLKKLVRKTVASIDSGFFWKDTYSGPREVVNRLQEQGYCTMGDKSRIKRMAKAYFE
jgi:hypothetical protein